MLDSEIFLAESQGSAIIDTACARTVCGKKWLENYMKELSQDQVNKMLQTEIPSCRPFQFGDGNVVYSNRKVKIPANIGQTKCCVETEVVQVDIPLLLSKTSLKRAGTVLDMKNDSAVMFKQPVPRVHQFWPLPCDIRDKGTEKNQTEDDILIDTEKNIHR